MGQYYKFINLDKREKCDRNRWPAKLTEHSYVGNCYCDDILTLMNKEWSGDRIIHVGDYAEKNDNTTTASVIEKLDNEFKPKESFYSYGEFFEDVEPLKVNNKVRYVYNLDKEEYIDLYHQPICDYFYYDDTIHFAKMNSFALLTACGNGLGGGDYHGNNDNFIGYWAGDHFVASEKKLDKYKNFSENDLVFFEFLDLNNLFTYDDYNKNDVISMSFDGIYDLITRLKRSDKMPKKIKVDISELTKKEYDVLVSKNIEDLKIPKFEKDELCR